MIIQRQTVASVFSQSLVGVTGSLGLEPQLNELQGPFFLQKLYCSKCLSTFVILYLYYKSASVTFTELKAFFSFVCFLFTSYDFSP